MSPHRGPLRAHVEILCRTAPRPTLGDPPHPLQRPPRHPQAGPRLAILRALAAVLQVVNQPEAGVEEVPPPRAVAKQEVGPEVGDEAVPPRVVAMREVGPVVGDAASAFLHSGRAESCNWKTWTTWYSSPVHDGLRSPSTAQG